jgi:hypothetical protein
VYFQTKDNSSLAETFLLSYTSILCGLRGKNTAFRKSTTCASLTSKVN